MLFSFFEEMMIPKPAYNLEINSLSHAAMTGQMMGKIEEILEIIAATLNLELKQIESYFEIFSDDGRDMGCAHGF